MIGWRDALLSQWVTECRTWEVITWYSHSIHEGSLFKDLHTTYEASHHCKTPRNWIYSCRNDNIIIYKNQIPNSNENHILSVRKVAPRCGLCGLMRVALRHFLFERTALLVRKLSQYHVKATSFCWQLSTIQNDCTYRIRNACARVVNACTHIYDSCVLISTRIFTKF